MAKAGAAKTPKADKAVTTSTEPVGFQEPTTTGTVKTNPPIEGDKAVIEKAKAEQKARDDAAKAEKQAARDAKKAEADKLKAEKQAARNAAKAEREARLAALAAEGKNYTGSMLALADRVKQGVYVKGSTGQLRSNDELAQALDGVSPTDVIRIGLDVLKLEENPYTALNVGQQSMNLRNRMRGAIKKETLKIDDIKDYIKRNDINVTTPEDLAKRAAEKAKRVADAAAAKEAKAKADAAKPAKPAEEAAKPGDTPATE